MMKTSLCSGPIGSSEISALPVLVTTVSTSGNFASRRRSISVPTAIDPPSEADGSRTTLNAIAPSSRGGRNSVPTKGTSSREAARIPAATRSVVQRRRNARESSGRYPRLRVRTIALSLASFCPRKKSEQRTGTIEKETTREPSMAKHMVRARGRNILPSICWSVNRGRNTMTMIRMANRTGRATSRTALYTISTRESSVSACSLRCRAMFSEMTMEASTIMPTAMASPPRLIRLAVTPCQPIRRKANRAVSGSERATITDALRFPRKRKRTSTTRAPP